MNQANPFVNFIEKYQYEPTLFCENVLNVKPDEWQSELMKAVVEGERKISVRSAHGVGKSSVASWILIHTLLTHLDCKLIVTAPTSRPTKISFLGTFPNRRRLPHSNVFSATTNITPMRAARGIISIH